MNIAKEENEKYGGEWEYVFSYLNDTQAVKNKINEMAKKWKYVYHTKIGSDFHNSVLVITSKKVWLDYLTQIEGKFNTWKNYEWVDWVDLNITIKYGSNCAFLDCKFEVERVEWEE
tara:strand:+ start:1413 stop:1760 length:348 start_codon:yes stop_codon:yes gene_type:complete